LLSTSDNLLDLLKEIMDASTIRAIYQPLSPVRQDIRVITIKPLTPALNAIVECSLDIVALAATTPAYAKHILQASAAGRNTRRATSLWAAHHGQSPTAKANLTIG